MTNVSAADNLQIDYSPQVWQIRNGDQAPMVYADLQGLHYNERFASTRRLPPTGLLTHGQSLQVIAGYQRTDESWHLGVVLDADLTAARGSRWCELAHWPDPDMTNFVDVAQSAGRGLATVLNVPFRLVEPRPVETAVPAEPIKPVTPLPDLPLTAGIWTLQRANQIDEKIGFEAQGDQLVFVRSKTWVNRHYRRMIWHSIWAIIYLWLSLVTIRGDTALPNAGTIVPDPHVLPYMGVVIAFGFVISVFYHAYRIRTVPNLIVVDPSSRTVSAWQGRNHRWSRSLNNVQSLYVSESLRQRSTKSNNAEHGELNFYLESGAFSHILVQGEGESDAVPPTSENTGPRIEAVRPLTNDDVTSSLQAMGLYMAQAFGLPAFYDRRVR